MSFVSHAHLDHCVPRYFSKIVPIDTPSEKHISHHCPEHVCIFRSVKQTPVTTAVPPRSPVCLRHLTVAKGWMQPTESISQPSVGCSSTFERWKLKYHQGFIYFLMATEFSQATPERPAAAVGGSSNKCDNNLYLPYVFCVGHFPV